MSIAGLPTKAKADYWLVIGSYRQGPGVRPEVSGITSPSVYSIKMDSLEKCNKAGEKIFNEIYKPVWQFDNRWTCVDAGNIQLLNLNYYNATKPSLLLHLRLYMIIVLIQGKGQQKVKVVKDQLFNMNPKNISKFLLKMTQLLTRGGRTEQQKGGLMQ